MPRRSQGRQKKQKPKRRKPYVGTYTAAAAAAVVVVAAALRGRLSQAVPLYYYSTGARQCRAHGTSRVVVVTVDFTACARVPRNKAGLMKI